MFQSSAKKVKASLEGLVKIIQEQLGDKTDEIFVSMRRDYRAVLGAGEGNGGELLPRPQRLCRREIKAIIDDVQAIFEKVVKGELVEDVVETSEDKEEKKSEEEDSLKLAKDEEEKSGEEQDDSDGNAIDNHATGLVESADKLKTEPVEEKQNDVPPAEASDGQVDEAEGTVGDDKTTTPARSARNAEIDKDASSTNVDVDTIVSPSQQLSEKFKDKDVGAFSEEESESSET